MVFLFNGNEVRYRDDADSGWSVVSSPGGRITEVRDISSAIARRFWVVTTQGTWILHRTGWEPILPAASASQVPIRSVDTPRFEARVRAYFDE